MVYGTNVHYVFLQTKFFMHKTIQKCIFYAFRTIIGYIFCSNITRYMFFTPK